jgi:hypothetical protein
VDPSPGEFLARPFVCGAVGQVRPEPLARLRQAVPGLVTVHEAADVLLLAAAPLSPYRSGEQVRAWSFGDRSPAATSDWQAAASDAEAPGLVDGGDRVVLHAGALGFIDLFTRQLGGATWFASRIEPLLSLDPAPLEVDWEAWASVLAFHCPMGDSTPFRAVRRLRGATTCTLERSTGRIRSGRWAPPWHGLPEVDPDAGDPVEVVEQLRDVLRRVGGGPYALALSGGFDSRLVAIAARDVGIPMVAWSTGKDDGLDDIEITRELAAMLGLPLRFVDPTAVPYGTAGDEVRRRTEGMVAMHTWMAPLGSALRANGQPVLTDIVGGVVIGGSNVTTEMTLMPPGPERRLALMARLQRPPIVGKTISGRAAPWVMDAARDRFVDAVRHLDGDANELVLAMMETRDARGIASMPLWLFGPSVRVETPVCRPEMLRVTLSVGARRKLRKGFSREVLAAADPVAGTLRTSHDPRLVPGRTRMHKASDEGLAWLRADIEHARSVPDLVPERLLRYLELGRWAGPRRRDRLLRRPQTPRPGAFDSAQMADMARLSLPIANLGSWIAANRSRLASIDPPWCYRRGRR